MPVLQREPDPCSLLLHKWPALHPFGSDGGFFLLKLVRCCECPKRGREWSFRNLHLFKKQRRSCGSRAPNVKCLPLPAAWLFPRRFQSSWVKQKLHNLSLFSRDERCLPQSLWSYIQWCWASCECQCLFFPRKNINKEWEKKHPIVCL